ncbi:MAG TPA: protein kinase, partial [Terriglobales bacterium]
GVPKLLDFGIAKLLDPIAKEQTVTRLSQRMMTLEYASPEQVYGGKVTPSADVYALGVLLHLLLAGRHPFQLKGKSPLEIGRIICEQPPEAPSRTIDVDTCRSPDDAARKLHGDLDHIVLMAMHKRPRHRYVSVDSLSRDVTAYLNEDPLSTRGYTRAQRVAKFVRRHKGVALVAALLLILALVGFVVGMVIRSGRASPRIGKSSGSGQVSECRLPRFAPSFSTAARLGRATDNSDLAYHTHPSPAS